MGIKKREEIDNKYKWNMEDVYNTEDEWNNDIEKVNKDIESISEYKGNICKSQENFFEFMEKYLDLQYTVEKIYFYANQRYHENLGDSKYQEFSAKADLVLNSFMAAVAFVEPELLEASEDTVYEYIKAGEKEEYRVYFENLFRQKSHILSDKEESLIAGTYNFSGGSSDIFGVLNNADIKFEDVNDENGVNHSLTHSTYIKFMESPDRNLRKEAFIKLYKKYDELKNTFGAIYINSLKKDNFYRSVRKYKSSREMYLEGNNVPESVYDNLVVSVNDNMDVLHDYVALRKKIMGLEEMHMYDMYVPLVSDIEKTISFDEAKSMVIDALQPMGEEYISILKEGLEGGWIDVYENEGKRSGAYSWSIYGVHPYVLLNHQDNLNDVFTLAHEMGHAIHSYYSNNNQPYINSEYKIFVAEVASTCNEVLLINYLMNNTEDKKEKAYYINHLLEQFRTTLFRQTMFAEFEKTVHEKADNGEPLNREILCNTYGELNKKYYGDAVISDDEIYLEWARVPHFYTSFYVYQYATSFSAAIALADRILRQEEGAVEDYKKFLKAGCSIDPISILKLAGVDMGDKKVIDDAMKVFKNLKSEFETLMGY